MEISNIADSIHANIEKQLDSMPQQVQEAILSSISSDTPVGSALRQAGGDDLLAYLSEVPREDLGRIAERFVHLDRIFTDDKILHSPDLGSLITVADSATHIIDQEAEDGGEKQYYDLMGAVASSIPALDPSTGELVSRYSLYQSDEVEEGNPHDVIGLIREGLSDINASEAELLHWSDLARSQIEDLPRNGILEPEDLPFSTDELNDVLENADQNHAIGKLGGQMLHALTGSSQPQQPEESSHSFLTDPASTEEWRNLVYGDGESEGDDGDDGDFSDDGGTL